MTDYKAPVRDIKFVRDEVFDYPALWQSLPHCEEASPDLIDAVLEAMATFCEEELAPLNQSGDEEGCTWTEDGVTTPQGFKEAYKKYAEGGWPGLTSPETHGGQALPPSMESILNEFAGSANWAWSMYPFLAKGARATIIAHGTEELVEAYIPKMVMGEWTGTMCLTEAHCGTDLGMLRTKAEPNSDGSYAITGSKIFISAGDHDLVENVVHIVIARMPDSPPGTKGISLFLVPKRLPDEQGNLQENGVSCGSIEHKMGIHGNATCVINFDGAKGFLLGDVNRGLNCMFTFMNTARVGTAIQGIAHGEIALQGATKYARERLQMRSLSGPKNPDGPADPIIVHPDVRRMLLTIKALTEGNRLLIHYLSSFLDITGLSEDEDARKRAEDLLGLLTPIAKGFITETGFECANHGVQVFGGHGYISEWGMEQNVRDSRIAMIYEGTNGIQALDLLGRKVLGSQGKLLEGFITEIKTWSEQASDSTIKAERIGALGEAVAQWAQLSQEVGMKAMTNPEEVGAASFDYLMYSGYVTLAYLWLRAAEVAEGKLKAGSSETDFYTAKLETTRFYFDRILPRIHTLAATIRVGADSLMAMDEQRFVVGLEVG
ncbi:MAG: acyl-CoA dehydrogenase [Gammaproteobacteria bacterium]|nr:MAG: acyl-CoA dehydrogenase [Gammaproteobacteria bacterium]RLA53267.1 MAG: acyl-CoA dehydrogenase [Gammaproteobacteria bacterium]